MSAYISEVKGYESELWLSQTETDFLERIARERCSAYNIFRELQTPTVVERNHRIHTEDIKILSRTDPKRLGKPMAYNNVLRRIKRLLELRLIKETTSTQSNPRKAKFYGITSKGLFYLIHFRLFLLRTGDLTQHHGDVILETTLFPYFEDSTLKRCTVHFKSILSLYLGECCEITLIRVKRIQEETNNDEKQRIANLLMDELKGAAKSMAVKVLNVDDMPERKTGLEQASVISYPKGDNKFVKLVNEVKEDLDQWLAMDTPRT